MWYNSISLSRHLPKVKWTVQEVPQSQAAANLWHERKGKKAKKQNKTKQKKKKAVLDVTQPEFG